MRIFIAIMFALGLLAAPAMVTTAHADSMKNCAASWKAMSAADKAKTTYKDYSSSCLKSGSSPAAASAAASSTAAMTTTTKPNAMAAAPAVGPVPAGATGQCKDGTYTMSKTHSGACSHHKGVAKWL